MRLPSASRLELAERCIGSATIDAPVLYEHSAGDDGNAKHDAVMRVLAGAPKIGRAHV